MNTYWGLTVYATGMLGIGVLATLVTTPFPFAVWITVVIFIALAAWRTWRRRQDIP